MAPQRSSTGDPPPSSARHHTTVQESLADGVTSNRSECHLFVAFSPDAMAAGKPIRLPIDGSVLPMGRDVDAPGLALSDARMSRLHLRVTWDARSSRHRLGDAGSTNGVFVNGDRVATAVLNPSDVVRAGDTVFVYEERDHMEDLRKRADRAARSDAGILLLGETGVGKEVFARSIHDGSGRHGSFIPVNCAALPRDLAAAELFGHTRGAFSGAIQARRGLFASADEGTLFLDEIGDLPLDLQPSLLRALQERAVLLAGTRIRGIPVKFTGEERVS